MVPNIGVRGWNIVWKVKIPVRIYQPQSYTIIIRELSFYHHVNGSSQMCKMPPLNCQIYQIHQGLLHHTTDCMGFSCNDWDHWLQVKSQIFLDLDRKNNQMQWSCNRVSLDSTNGQYVHSFTPRVPTIICCIRWTQIHRCVHYFTR